MLKYTLCFLTACALLSILPTTVRAADAGPLLSVDVTAERHAISPDIYGMNVFGADTGFRSAACPSIGKAATRPHATTGK